MINADDKNLFSFEQGTVYLDHGGYGVAPTEVSQEREKIAREIEKAPGPFFNLDYYRPMRRKIAASVAERFLVGAEDLALVDNVTDGINAVLRSLAFQPDDEILATSLTYGAIANAATYIAQRQGARVVEAELKFPDPEPEQCIEAVKNAITRKTRLAILDHISSATALVMPIAEMVRACHECGVPVLVDGAHAPGQVAVDIKSVNADWYAANLHKWYFVPRACGFLWRNPVRQERLVPNVLSWDIGRPFPDCFEWTGTRDPSALLSIPKAFAFMDRFGEENVRRHNHALIRQGAGSLAEAWKIGAKTPDEMIGSMTMVPLPRELPFAVSDEGRREFQKTLWKEFRIAAQPCFGYEDRSWIRLSAQIYNDIGDYERLATAVLGLCGRGSGPFPS